MDQHSPLCSGDDAAPSGLIGQVLQRLHGAVTSTVSSTRQHVMRSFVVLFVTLLLLCLAAFLYGSFYYSYMPTVALSTPVHYYYRTDCDSPVSYLCSYPVANVSLMRNKKHVLTFGQAYQISLQLEMPESPANQELGMLMIRITCFSQDGDQLASSERSARHLRSASTSRLSMLRYQSDLLRTLGTLLFLPAFLTGATEQRQELGVELFSDYTDDPYAPTVTAVIELLSSRVQVYSSQLNIHAHFTGIRYFLFYFPVMSALVGVSSNYVVLSFLFVLSHLRLLMRLKWKPERTRGQLRPNGPVSERERNDQQEDDKDVAGSSELLDPIQTAPTDRSWKRPHLHVDDSTELQNSNTHGQVETNQSEAA